MLMMLKKRGEIEKKCLKKRRKMEKEKGEPTLKRIWKAL